MLFGDEEIRLKLLEDADKFAKKNNMKLVYGSMVGGISRGLHYRDSDYDTRFLYIRKDFPEHICTPSDYEEKDLVKRYYNKTEQEPYEWIPFWEMTSFFQFMATPCFRDKFSAGLAHIVGWTMCSPYTWDPYGLQNKVTPLLHQMFCPFYELIYQKQQMDQYLIQEKEIVIKDYLYGIYAALSADWVMRFHSFAPVYMRTLLSCVGIGIKEEVEALMRQSLQKSEQYLKREGKGKLHGSHFAGVINRSSKIDEYICKIRGMTERDLNQNQQWMKKCDEREKEILRNIYQIVAYSVFNEQSLETGYK